MEINFEVGMTLFFAAHGTPKVRAARLETLPHKADSGINGCLVVTYLDGPREGQTVREFLGDRGYGKYKYDDRPQQIFSNKEDAEKGLVAANEWYENMRAEQMEMDETLY